MRRNFEECLAHLRQAVAELLGVATEAVPASVPLRELGLDSAGLGRLVDALSRRLERQVPAWAVWQYPTVAALSEFLAGTPRSAASPRPSAGRPVSATEPIAIVGLGCRLPGGIGSPDQLWDALLSEVDAVRTVPADRWDADQWFDQDVAAPGKSTTRWGAFLDDVEGFDAAFFRISPAEAERMDPQQRIALEVAWSALEDARVVPERLSGSRTGVFFGSMWQEYHLATGADPASIGPQSAVGWDTSIIPARISYALGLQGPVMSVGTACSSSLAAVHLAAHSLRRGESDWALAGGVSLMLHPHTTVAMTKFGGMNPDGQCRAFDADAAGYVRGEGCGVLVLRRLADALRDGDRIYAVLRGSAMNNDGASNGLTAPNPQAQVDVLRAAWQEAGVPANEVSYVEAHGTGTPLGDLIEASALGEVFAPERARPLRVGSVKTNFGHLEPAAGVLGVLKTVLALHHGEIPASLHFDSPNPKIDFAGWKLAVVTRREPWPDRLRYAGVSGFGFGGTNVHIALAPAPHQPRRLVALAAGSAATLRERVEDVLRSTEPTEIQGVGPHRVFVALDSEADRHDALSSALTAASEAAMGEVPRVAFCFSGHGAQWAGMGRDLLPEPAFRAALSEVDEALGEVLGWSVVDELVAADSRPEYRTDVIQPVLFAVQVALARTLDAWGVRPDVVFGQSIGEVAAAVAAGALTLEQGARVIGIWSRLVAERADGKGTVLVCEMRADAAAQVAGSRLSVAGMLSPGRTCLSGPNDAVADIEQELTAAGVRTRRVAIGYAAHSAALTELVPELLTRLGEVRPANGVVPFVSTVSGNVMAGDKLHAEYWARNMYQPMRLTDALRVVADGRPIRIVEIGPHPVLRTSLKDTLAAGSHGAARVLISCRRGRPARHTLEELVGQLWMDGVDVDWPAVAGSGPSVDCQVQPLLLSARSETALRAQARTLREHLISRPDWVLADVARSLATTRSTLEHRAVLIAGDRGDALAGLAALTGDLPAPGVVTGVAGAGDTHAGPVLVFPGQGAQWVGMARELLDSSPVFAARFTECARALEEFVDWSPFDVVDDEAALARTDVLQPVLWAVLVSLAQLWQEYGVRPSAVIGHSQGEIAAACVAGALSIRDGALIVALRGKIIARELSGCGGMVSVNMSRERTMRCIASWDDRLSFAAELSPSSTVVAGDHDALEVLLARCRAEGIRAGRVAIDYPSHSAKVGVVRDELLAVLAPIQPRSTEVTFLSTVTGEPMDTADLDAEYWYRNLRAPIEFRAAIERLVDSGHRVFVEASPHPVLTMGIQATGAERDLVVVGSLRRGEGGLGRFVTSVAQAHVGGARISWDSSAVGRVVDLPTYQFQHRRYWLGTQARGGQHPRQHNEGIVRDWRYEITWIEVTEPSQPRAGTWLTLVPGHGGLPSAALDGLVELGMKLVTVQCTPDVDRDTLSRACADVVAEHDIDGVLSLLALDTTPHPDYPAVPMGYAATLLALQALGDAAVTAPLWCVTSGAMVTGPADRTVCPDQRMVWALGQVARYEYAERWGGLVDLPTAPGDDSWALLAAVLDRDDDEDQIAIRDGGMLARRLVRAEDRCPRTEWRPSGTVLITGGTGALGGHVAKWVACQGAERVVLTSRRGRQAPEAAALEEELRALGTDVLIEECDVADREAVADLLDRIEATGRLTAVVHAAAVLDGAVLDALELDQVENVLRVKARGARHLHELTSGMDLSAFVLFSSFGATVGIPGQGNYAPGNAYLDGLAELRHAQGLPATSVSWGAWAGDGIARAASGGVADRLGVPGMAPDLAVRALQHAIDNGRPCQTIADVRWDRFLPTFTAARPNRLLADLPDTRYVPDGPSETGLRQRLAGLPAHRRMNVVLDLVLQHTAAVLGYGSGDQLDPARAFRELGFSSVTGVDLSNRLSTQTGLNLPVTLVFEHPTVAALAAHLLAGLDDKDGVAQPLDVPALEAALTHIDPATLSGSDRDRLRFAMRRLEDLLSWKSEVDNPGDSLDEDISDDELFRFIDRKLGPSPIRVLDVGRTANS